MANKKNIAEQLIEIVASNIPNEQINEFQSYRDCLKNEGLLKEDTFNLWSNYSQIHKQFLINRTSKNSVFTLISD